MNLRTSYAIQTLDVLITSLERRYMGSMSGELRAELNRELGSLGDT